MALDKDYFDAIHIDVVKKKYYNANKVNALLEDIRGQAEALEAENGALKAQLGEISRRRDEIGDTLLTAQAAARDIIGKAKVQAGRILADAQRQREEILSGAADQQEYAVACVERAFDIILLNLLVCFYTTKLVSKFSPQCVDSEALGCLATL